MNIIKKLLTLLVLLQQFSSGFLFMVPNVNAQTNTVSVSSTPSLASNCNPETHILVYKGKSIPGLADEFYGGTQDFVKFSSNVAQTNIKIYNPSSIFSNPSSFSKNSSAKFPGTNGVIRTSYSPSILVNNNITSRTTKAAQIQYYLGFVTWPQGNRTANTNLVEYQTTTSNTYQTGKYAGNGPNSVNSEVECQSIYVAYCGDGIKDNGTANVKELNESEIANYVMNGNEACDNGGLNGSNMPGQDGTICSNTCQVVTPPATPGACTNLTITPGLTGNNPYTIGFTCAGTNVTGYSIKINGTQISTNAIGNHTFNTAGTYNVQCFVNGQTSTPTVCTKSVVVSNPPVNPVCSGLTLTPPNGGQAPFNQGYSCVGANGAYSVILSKGGGVINSSTLANGSFNNLGTGSYTVTCTVGGVGSPACTKTFTVTAPPAAGSCSNLQVFAQPGNIPVNNGIPTTIPNFPITVSYTTQSVGTVACELKELVNGVETWRQTKTGANGAFTYSITSLPNNQSNVFWVKCFVNGQMPNGTTNTCNMDFWFVKNVPPVIAPDLTITKDVTPTVVSSGDIVTYTIVVTHNGPAGAVNAKSWKLEDALPAGQIWNAGYTSAGGNGNKCGNLSNNQQGPTNVNATVVGANLAVGESCTYTLKAKVVNSSPSTQTNNICVTTVVGSGNINETNTSNNCDDATVTVNQPVPAFCNGITVSANGTQLIHANNGVNTVNFPASISYNLNRTGTSLSCMLKYGPNMTVLSTVNNASNGTFTPPVNGTGTYRVSCKLNGTIDPRIAGVNECSFDFTIVPPVVHTIDLELDKRYANGGQSCQTYNSGDLINYVIEVTNKGTAGVTNFTVKDYIPAGFVHVAGGSANGNTVTFNYPGTLAPNQSTTFNLTVKALGATNPDAYNKAEVCNYNGMNSNTNPKDPDSNPCDMTATGTPDQDDEDQLCTVVVNPITPTIDIELDKSLSDPTHTMFNSGETVTFNITVSNKGNTAVTNASVKDYLPALALTNVVASNGGIVNGNLITWNGVNLAPGASIVFTVTAKAVYNSINPDPCNKAEAGNYEISGGPQDPDSNGFTMGVNGNPSEDDEDKVCFWVNQPEPDKFDIELTKTLTTPTTSIVSGGFVGFKIRVYNNSNVTIPAGYQVKDQRPNNIQFISASNGGVYSAPIVTRTLNAPLAAFSEVNLYVTGKVLSAGWYDNCAEAGSYNGSNSTNNPRDIDSDPFNHPGQDVEDDESCVGFDVPTPNNPTTCDSITVNPTTGSVPLTVTYNCNATNATTYTVQLIQNGVATNIGTAPIGTYTITNPGAYTIKCLVNNTITSPTCQTPINAGVAPFIDLNIKKLFADNNSSSHVNFNSGDTISFKLIVGNSGNTTATNFTVKDYLPASLQFVSAVPTQASITPNGMGNTVTRNIASLAPGATTTITVNAKIIEALRDKNKTEVCDYEENGEPQDPDSAPCNMGPGGTPNEDDEDLVMWDVNDPSPSVTCDNLTATPLSGTVPYNVNYTCAGQGATSYVVKIFGGNLGVNGLVVGNTAAGSFTMTYSGNYTLQCFVNGTTTSSACNKNIIGTPPYIPPSTGTKCNYITVNPNGGNSPLNVNFFCNGGYSGTNTNFPLQYVVNVSGPNGFNQSYVTASGNVLLSGAGNYSFACSVGGATATACNKNVNVVNPSCPNGATNPPSCNNCPTGYILSGGICVLDCPMGQILSGGQCIPCPTCIPDCGTGYTFTGGQCVLNPCTNGAINPPNCTLCPAGTTYTGGQCITNTGSCTNGATNYPACNSCPIGKIFSGNQCITPPNPNGGSCDVQCLNLTAQGTAAVGQSISFTCNKSGGNTTQILISLNGNTVATLQGPTANYTFNTAGNYTAQCLVDNSVDYKCDYFKNYCLAPLQCAYKIKPNGGKCAVQATLAPYQTQVIPPSFRVTMPAPIEYCTANEVATLPCHDNSNLPNYGVVRNHDVCKQTFTISGSNQCTNGAINYPACNSCAAGYTWNGSSCVIANCTNGATNPPACNSCPAGYIWNGVSCNPMQYCTNGATNYPACNSCPSGYTWNGNSCVIANCTNGATNPPYCNSCPSGYSLINGVCQGNGGGGYNPQPFAYCGNGRQEIGEYCDYKASNVRQSDYIITDGPYKGKKCEMNCRIENETDAPKCMDIDPPSINEGEQFPFRWNIDNSDTKFVTSCSSSSPDTVLKSSMQCFFNVYNGKRGTTDPVIKDIKLDCYNQDSNFNTTLMSYWNTKSSDADGRKVVTFDKGTTNGIYGEYKIELSKIEYSTCDAPSTKKVFDDRVCQYNFVVGEGYMIQKGANISTLKDTSIVGYYGFGSNTPRFDLYLKGVQQSLTLANFDATRNMNYISTDFVSKYSELATNAGVGVSKVPGKDIYIYDSSVTLDDNDLKDLSTIIVKNGNLRIEGSVAKNILYVVPNGTIEFGGDANCDKYTDDALPQVVQGIFVAGQGFASDNYLNTNSNKSRCHNGGLKIRGTLIGKGVETLIEKRRVVLNDWFQGASPASKTQHILDGASLLINPNATLWNTLPGADELAKVLGVEKK